MIPEFKAFYKSLMITIAWYGIKLTHGSREENREFRNQIMYIQPNNFDNV